MKRTISLLLTLVMAFAFIPNVYASYLVDEGVCGMNGDNVKWTLDDEGTLIFSGTGDMPGEYLHKLHLDYGRDVLKLIITPGFTSVGEECAGFYVTNIVVPDGVTLIKDLAFYSSVYLSRIEIPDSVTEIQEAAFLHCCRLEDVYYTGTEEQWSKINIDYRNNDELKNATVHFNSHMQNDTRMSIPTITKPSQYSFGYSGEVTIENLKTEATLIAVFYRNDDIIFEGTKTIDPGERVDETFGYTPPTDLWPIPIEMRPTSCKLFLWKDLESMQPLCEAREIEI